MESNPRPLEVYQRFNVLFHSGYSARPEKTLREIDLASCKCFFFCCSDIQVTIQLFHYQDCLTTMPIHCHTGDDNK